MRRLAFNYKPAMNAHQLFCVEMKLKSEYQFLGNNFYLKIGMIPIWNEDYSEIVGYYDKPVIDFHD